MINPLFLFLFFSVRGVIHDPHARPVPGASITCAGQTTLSDDHGEFEFAVGPCDATVAKDGFTTQHLKLADSGNAVVTLALAPSSERVVVTATGAPVAIEEAGVAADVFTAKDFAIRKQPFVADILRDVPGIAVVQTGNNGGLTSLFARGGDSNAALVLLDGVPLTEPGGSLDFAHLTATGLDRIEVIRGPESVLFGAEASSGVIQMFTLRGDPESTRPHLSAAYERGSFSTDHWNATVDGGLANRIDYALNADQFRSTGEFANDAYRITTGTANLGYRFSDRTSVRGIFREFDSYTGVPGQVYYRLFDTAATEVARDSAVSLHLDDARGSRFVQRASLGYHRYRDLFNDTGEWGPYNVAALVRTVPGVGTYLVRQVDPSTTVTPPGTSLATTTVYPFASTGLTVTDRTDAAYQGTFTHRGGALVFGYEYERQAGVISTHDVTRNENGFYAHEQYALTQRIFLTGGARVQHSNIFGTEFAPRGSITFRLPREVFFRISAARGIKEPSLLENFANETFFVGNLTLKPAKTESYEAALSREWFARRVRTNVSVFRNSFHDLISFDGSVFPSTWRNIAESWARGVEFSGSVAATRYLTFRGAYTLLYTKITRSDAGDVGNELIRRPRNAGSISLELTPRRWSLIAGARFVGERADNDFVFGVTRNPSYQFVYATGSWQATRHIAPFLRLQNALDERYQEALGYAALSRNYTGGVRLTF